MKRVPHVSHRPGRLASGRVLVFLVMLSLDWSLGCGERTSTVRLPGWFKDEEIRILWISKLVEKFAETSGGRFPAPAGAPEMPFSPDDVRPGSSAQRSSPFGWMPLSDFSAMGLIPMLEKAGVEIRDARWTDPWGNPIHYAVSTDRQNFLVYSYGSDGKRDDPFRYSWPAGWENDPSFDIVRDRFGFLSFPPDITR